MAGVFDAIVVGAGPAGASAALCLAKAGCRVALLERGRLPHPKTCGGGLVGKTLARLPVDASLVTSRAFCRVALTMPEAGLSCVVERPSPVLAVTLRESFDTVLAREAEAHGATLYEDLSLRGLEEDGALAVVRAGQERLSCRFVIGADGVLSPTARAMGWTETRRLGPALSWRIVPEQGCGEAAWEIPRFDFGCLPKGYGWVFPAGDHLCVGLASVARGSLGMERRLALYLRGLGLHRAPVIRRGAALIPLSPRRDGFFRGRTLLVGDAAGFVDPLTGEGIGNALWSGEHAALAILEGGGDPKRVGRCYGRTLGRTLLPELAAGRLLARLLYDFPGLSRPLLAGHGRGAAERITDVMTGATTYRGILRASGLFLKGLLGFRRAPRQEKGRQG